MTDLPLTSLADLLQIDSVVFDIQRNDEVSGTGDGRIWQAELADPLWTAEVSLQTGYKDDLKRVAAIIRGLRGAQESFLLYDPQSLFPHSDPDGSILGASEVLVASIPVGRRKMSLTGLPAGYKLTAGDKGQIIFATTQNYFFEFSEDAEADGDGETGDIAVFPDVPVGIVGNEPIILTQPACRMIIMPGTHKPGTSDVLMTTGAGFSCVERRR